RLPTAPPTSPLFPYTTLFRSFVARLSPSRARTTRRPDRRGSRLQRGEPLAPRRAVDQDRQPRRHDGRRCVFESRAARVRRAAQQDRKSTRLNSSHLGISYAVF